MRIMKAASMVIAVAVTAGLSLSCSGQKPAAPAETTPEKKSVKVRTTLIQPSDFTKTLTLTGSSKPWKEVVVASEAGGRITKIAFEKGARVKAGEPLVWIDDSTTKAELSQAEAARDMAALEHRKLTALQERNAGVSEFQIDQARLILNQAEARVAAVKAFMGKLVITAPISGTLVTREVEIGAIIAPGQPISRLVSTDPIKVTAGMPEMAIADFRSGVTAVARFDAFPEKEHEGVITFISPAVNPVTRTFDLEALIPNRDGKLFPDMGAKLTVPWRRVKDAMLIPQSAIVELPDGHAIFVVEGKTARQRRVEVDDVSGEMALVTDGLKAGESLVIVGQRSLIDGDPVEIAEK